MKTAQTPAPRTVQQLPEREAGLLQKLSFGWIPPSFDVQGVSDFDWGGEPFSGADRIDLAVSGDELRLRLVGTPRGQFSEAYQRRSSLEGAPLGRLLTDGRRVRARAAYMSGWTNVSGSTAIALPLVADDWTLQHENSRPRFWLARVEDGTRLLERAFEGNLVTCSPTKTSSGHLRLRGKYTYFLVQGPKRESSREWWQQSEAAYDWTFVVDTGAEQLNVEEVFADVLILQFLLGRHLRMGCLHGIDDADEVVALSAGTGGVVPQRAHRNPLIPVLHGQSWLPVFFENFARTWRTRSDIRFYVPAQYYLDALADHIDGSYARLHIALEAFSQEVLGAGDRGPLVSNPKQWEAWVEMHSDEIGNFARDGKGDKLIHKVKSAMNSPSSRYIEDAFVQHKLDLDSEMRKEIKGRNKAVHEARMYNGKLQEAGVEVQVQRRDRVRTMLAALVARVVGYGGPLVGWNGGEQQPPPSWWSVDEGARPLARTLYLAGEDTEGFAAARPR